MMRKAGILGFGFATLLLMTSPVGATTVGITDIQNGWTVSYSLTYFVEGNHYDAALTITTSLAPGPLVKDPWYITDVAFKFYDGSPVISITPEGPNAGGMSVPWNPHDGFYGFRINPGFPTGLPINGGSITYDFDFDFGSLVAKNDFINFFVDYTGAFKNNPSGGYYETNLSSYLTVPEPGTALLLGSGLLSLVGYGRRKLKK